jgi:hypothetical protein
VVQYHAGGFRKVSGGPPRNGERGVTVYQIYEIPWHRVGGCLPVAAAEGHMWRLHPALGRPNNLRGKEPTSADKDSDADDAGRCGFSAYPSCLALFYEEWVGIIQDWFVIHVNPLPACASIVNQGMKIHHILYTESDIRRLGVTQQRHFRRGPHHLLLPGGQATKGAYSSGKVPQERELERKSDR